MDASELTGAIYLSAVDSPFVEVDSASVELAAPETSPPTTNHRRARPQKETTIMRNNPYAKNPYLESDEGNFRSGGGPLGRFNESTAAEDLAPRYDRSGRRLDEGHFERNHPDYLLGEPSVTRSVPDDLDRFLGEQWPSMFALQAQWSPDIIAEQAQRKSTIRSGQGFDAWGQPIGQQKNQPATPSETPDLNDPHEALLETMRRDLARKETREYLKRCGLEGL